MFRRLIMAIFRLYMKYLLSRYTKRTILDILNLLLHKLYNTFFAKSDPILCIPLMYVQFARHTFETNNLILCIP